jgi:hypothetical protein
MSGNNLAQPAREALIIETMPVVRMIAARIFRHVYLRGLTSKTSSAKAMLDSSERRICLIPQRVNSDPLPDD